MPAPPPSPFHEQQTSLPLPHTDEVRRCEPCDGSGRQPCGSCGASGRVSCTSCGGSGSTSSTNTITDHNADGSVSTRTETVSSTCMWCHGSGRVTCSTCGGDGVVVCSTCEGQRRVVAYERLDVAWEVRRNDIVLEATDLPDQLVPRAGAIDDEREEADTLVPGSDADAPYRTATPMRVSPPVNAAANQLLELHRPESRTKVRRQRLVVRGVPVYEVAYRHRGQARKLWIYGADRRVHAPDFPLAPLRVLALAMGITALVALVVLWLLAW